MTRLRWPQTVAIGAALAVVFTVSAVQVRQQPATAHQTCGSPAAAPGHPTTLCITVPDADAEVSGRVPITATVQVGGAAPAVTGIRYTLDGKHLLFDGQSPYRFMLHTYLSTVGAHTLAGSVLFADGFASNPVKVPLHFGGSTAPSVPPFTPSLGSEPPPGQPLVLGAAGDGAAGGDGEQGVADLVSSWNPNLFAYLGGVEQDGSAEEYLNWYGENGSYFSRFRPITNPTGGTDPDYWGNPPVDYSLTTHGWHIVSLAASVGDAAQYQWLLNDLQANTAPCTLIQTNKPIFGSEANENAAGSAGYRTLLATSHVTAVLSGRTHNYQRWQPMDGDSHVSPGGVTQFAVGTTGGSVSPFTATDPRVATHFDTTDTARGALQLGLSSAGATFRFQNAAGQTEDFGSMPCQGGPDTVAPTAPTGVSAHPVSGREVSVSWTAATDNVGVASDQIVRDGTVIGIVPGYQTTFTDTTTAALTGYSYTVVAGDAAGNRSPPSSAATATTQAAAPAYVQGATLGTSRRGESTRMRLGQPVRAGDLLVGWFGQYDSTGQVQVSDDVDGAWTRVQGEAYSSGQGDVALYYTKAVAAPDGVTVTVSAHDPTYLQAAVGDYWGTAAAGAFAASAISQGKGTTASSGPTVAAPAGALVFVGLLSGGAPDTITVGKTNGVQLVTRSAVASQAVVVADATVAMAGPQQANAALGVPTDWYAGAAVFRPASVADPVAPTAPAGVAATAPPNSPVALGWTAATDNVGVTGYTVYRDGATLGDTDADQQSYTDTTATPNAYYSYTVVAYDAAGNRSPASAATTVSTPSARPSYVQSGVVSTGARVRSATAALPKPVRAGDLLVGWFGQYDAAGQVQVADSVNGTWTRARGETFATGKGDVALYSVRAPRDIPNGVTVTVSAESATYLQGAAADYGGTGSPGPLTASALASGTSRAADSGVAAVTSAGAIVVTGLITGGDPAAASAAPSGTLTPTVRSATRNGSAAIADLVNSDSGIQHGAFTLSNTTDWYAMSAVFGS